MKLFVVALASFAIVQAFVVPRSDMPAETSPQADENTQVIDPSGHHNESQIVPLTVQSYDVAVANANGYEIKNVDGELQSVKVSDGPINQTVTPQLSKRLLQPSITGNCGEAHCYYKASSGRKAKVSTGFKVPGRVIDFIWKVAVVDNIGTGHPKWPRSGWNGVKDRASAFDGKWSADWETTHGTTGFSSASVELGLVYLTNGALCIAANPGQATWLYN